MHYGDDRQLENSKLIIIVYKHEIMGRELKRNVNGVVSKRCVHYEISSVQEMRYINPRVVTKLLADPYKYLSKMLDKLPNEEWILVEIGDKNGWGKLKVHQTTIVSKSANDFYKLH